MAYRKIGIVAVMDVAGFLPNVAKFLSSVQRMNQTVIESTASMSRMQSPVASLGKAFGVVSIAAGALLASNAFKQISDGLADLASRAEKAAETFQLLEVRFTTLAARDYMREQGGAVSMEQALEATSGAAKENIEWLRRLAVTTPYTVKSLSDMAAYAQSAGFTNTQVKQLAQTIGDFAAGMGLTSEHVDRIIWNFAQMKSAGRVLGRELRDLGNSMIPVDYLIEKLAGEFKVTKEEMKAMLQSGQVNADKFISTFNEMSEVEFAGAMERMSNTLSFAKENLKDFIDTMLGLDVLKPTADVIGQMLNDMLQVLLSPEARRATIAFGFALRESFLSIVEAVKTYLIPSIQEFMSSLGAVQPTTMTVATAILNIGFAINFMIKIFSGAIKIIAKIVGGISDVIKRNFTKTAENSQTWGANIIVMFAEGMAAAIGAVFKVLSYLAAAISAWLKPGSPPKILPDIDEWGEAAMNEYLQGWLEADFGVFDDISSIIEKYVNAFTELDVKDSVMRILGGRAAAAEVIDEWGSIGDVPVEEINKITDAVGISNETMTNYLRSLFNLRKVSEDAAEAEGILAYELEGTTTVLGNVVDSLEEAQAAAIAYTGAAAENVRAYIASLTSLSVAQRNLDNAQKALNNTTKYYDDILEQLYLKQNKLNDDLENSQRLRVIDKTLRSVILTAEERERLELEKRGILLKREIRDTELARDSAVSSAKDKVDLAQQAVDAAKEAAEIQKKLALDIVKATEDQVQAQADSYRKLLEAMIKNRELMNQMLKSESGGGATEEEKPLPFGWPTPEEEGEEIEDLSAGIEEAILALAANLKSKWEHLFDDVKSPFTELEGQIDTFLAVLDEAAKQIKEHPIKAALIGLGAAITLNLGIGALKGFGASLATALGGKGLFSIIGKLLAGASLADVLAKALVPKTAVVAGLLRTLWISISTEVGLFFMGFGPKIAALVPGLLNPVGLALAAGVLALMLLVKTGVAEKAGETLKMLGTIISLWWTGKALPALDGLWTGVKEAFVKVWNGLFGPDGKIAEFHKSTDEFFKKQGEKWFGENGFFSTLGKNIVDNIKKAWDAVFGPDGKIAEFHKQTDEFFKKQGEKWFGEKGFFSTLYDNIKTALKTAWNKLFGVGGLADTLISDFAKFGSDLIGGIIEGFGKSVGKLWSAIVKLVKQALGLAKEESDSHSASKKWAIEAENWILGLVKGIEDNAYLVDAAIKNLVSDPLSANKSTVSLDLLTASTVSGSFAKSFGSQNTVVNNQYIDLEVNPSYSQVQSPASVYYDVTAALASVRR